MAINYAASDLLHRFSVSEAAALWMDLGRITEDNLSQFMIIRSAIIEAIKAEKLKADEVPRKIVERRIRGGLYDMEEPDYEKAYYAQCAQKMGGEKQSEAQILIS